MKHIDETKLKINGQNNIQKNFVHLNKIKRNNNGNCAECIAPETTEHYTCIVMHTICTESNFSPPFDFQK